MKKNNTFVRFFGCCLSIILVFSCDRVSEEKIRSYVVGFYDFNTVWLELTEKGNIALYWCDATEIVTFQSEGKESERYDLLCTKYNDLSYYKKTRYIVNIGCREYASNEITSIDVVSNVDFDVEHPAGSSLSDVVRLLSASPIRFIHSNYKETFDWNARYPQEFLRETSDFHGYLCAASDGNDHFPVNGTLTDLRQDDFKLIGTGWDYPVSSLRNYGYFFGYLTFEKEPDNPGVHELTVSIHLADGRTITQTIEKSFE